MSHLVTHTINNTNLKSYYSGNSLKVDKKEKGFSTFDDGLLFTFPLDKYEHLTYYCRTSTPHMDTCNVKLFKKGEKNSMTKEHDDAQEPIEYMPPLKRKETVLFSRLGYHKYFKVNCEVDSMLLL